MFNKNGKSTVSKPECTGGVWWRLTSIQDDLHSSSDGLSNTEVQQRLLRYGPNRLSAPAHKYPLFEILDRLRNPLVLLLLIAGAISAVVDDATSAGIIALMVVLSVTFDYVQEHKAELAADRLRKSVALKATVRRDGVDQEVAVEDLVPGDIVSLSAGCLVPGDGLVLSAADLFIQQAALTGESFPVEKHATAIPDDDALDRATNAVFMGSNVISGMASVLIVKTGESTQLGMVGGAISQSRPPTAFDNGIRHFGYLILRVTFLLVLFVLLVNGLAHRPWLESFLFSLALAVGLTPELLPMVVTVTLSRGALRLAKHGVIVKRLSAMQNLGAMDILCTDKTGTLTEAKISLSCHVDIGNQDNSHVLELAYLNSSFETGVHTPLEDAILAHESVDIRAWTKIDEVPFDFERRRLSVLLQCLGEHFLVVKGAPEDVLTHCGRYEGVDGEAVPWTEPSRILAQQTLTKLSMDGYRVLGIAWKKVPADVCHVTLTDESNLIFAGYAAFLDPPKEDAGEASANLSRKGIAVKILTGDNELVAQHVCKTLDIPVTSVLMGYQIAKLDDRALSLQAEAANLFCRINPIQKNRLILALRSRGHVVGFMGDGINDAPALHSADVSISVDTAVDVAKDSADLIMLKHDLSMLEDGVNEGRRTFANIRKYIMMGTSSNFGNMFSMAGATLFLPFLPMLPTQVLLNNILYDLSETVLPLDEVDEVETATPQHWNIKLLRNFMLVLGPVSSSFDFATFYLLLTFLKADEGLFQTGWFIESLATQILVIFIIRTRGNPFLSRPHPALWIAAVSILLVAAIIPFSPLAGFFGFVALPWPYFLALSVLVFMYLALAQAVKVLFYRSNLALKHS
ncbi:magnesium-translocating P-type ATPase [Alcaligenaceae bacterium CGII-47]|nr:magnesium-translocating P-type ATPase [Alcaligenaceae bacterium CGII-47]